MKSCIFKAVYLIIDLGESYNKHYILSVCYVETNCNILPTAHYSFAHGCPIFSCSSTKEKEINKTTYFPWSEIVPAGLFQDQLNKTNIFVSPTTKGAYIIERAREIISGLCC